MKLSKLSWYLGISGVVLSGAFNVVFLYETLGMVTIEVPSRTLQPYHAISSNDIKTRMIPKSSLLPDAVTGNLVGRITKLEIPQNDQFQSFELASQGSMAQVIQSLYIQNPQLAFTQVSIPNSQLNQSIQANQYVNFISNNIVYPHVWVLSISVSGQNMSLGSQISGAINSFTNSAISSSSSSSSSSNGSLTVLIGAPWSTIQSLMNTNNVEVVLGNVGNGASSSPSSPSGQQFSLGSPPVSQQQNTIPSYASQPTYQQPSSPPTIETPPNIQNTQKYTKKAVIKHGLGVN